MLPSAEMTVEVFALCEGAGAAVVRAFIWEDVFRGVTSNRLLADVDSCEFVGLCESVRCRKVVTI